MEPNSNGSPFHGLNPFNETHHSYNDSIIVIPSADLDTLPNELVAKIVSDPCLSMKDIAALRFTCKFTYAFATEVFAKHYFTELRVLMSPYSLRTVNEICKHPGFGPWVRKVILTSIRVDPCHLDSFTRHQPLAKSNEPTSVLEACDELQACIARYRYETDLLKDDKAVKELTSSFQSLARYGNPIVIAVSETEEASIGLRRSYHKSSKVGHDKLFVTDYQTALRTLIAGASRSTCKIYGLELKTEAHHNGPESSRVDINILDGHLDQPFWNGLEMVNLDIDGKPEKLCKRRMAQIVSLATNLKYLFYQEDQSLVGFESVVTSVRSCCLKQIVLADFAVQQSSLIQLLTRNRASIHGLYFYRAKLMSGSWRFVISWIKDNLPRLVHIEVLMLSHMKGKTFVKPAKEFNGKENVQAGLGNLLLEELT